MSQCIVGFGLLVFCYFYIYAYQLCWSVILFFCGIFVWFWYQGDGGLIE